MFELDKSVEIKLGDTITAKIPEMFLDDSKLLSKKLVDYSFKVGSIFKRETISIEKFSSIVSNSISKLISVKDISLSNDEIIKLCNSLVSSKLVDLSEQTLDTSCYVGSYTICGISQYSIDLLPDYYSLKCENIIEPSMVISFYRFDNEMSL